MSPSKWAKTLTFFGSLLQGVCALLNATENSTLLSISNERLYAAVDKKTGVVSTLTLDGQNLLGTRSGSVGIGPYLDCYCKLSANLV
jgi:rhamnogalacturonan endolyase